MKKFKRTLATAVLTSLCAMLQAQTLIVENHTREAGETALQVPDMKDYRLVREQGNRKTYVPASQKPRPAEVGTVTVTCQMEAHETELEYSPDMVTVISNGLNSEIDGEEGSVVLTLPKGCYDFLTHAYRTDGAMALVLKEQIDVNTDTTLVFNLDDATIPYSTKTYKPNGELCEVDVMRLYYGERDDEVVTPGNVQNISGFTSLVSKEEGDVFGLIYSRSFCEADSRDESYSNIIFMNPISDRYRFVDARLVIDDEANTWYVVKSENKSMAEQTLSNTPDLFVELEQQFEDTPGGNFDKGNHSFLMLRAAVKNKEVPIAYTMPKFSSARGSMKAFIDAPKNTDDSSAHIDIYTYMCYADHERADTTVFEWYDENGQLQRFEAINYIVQRTESNPIVQTGSSLRSICSGRALYDPRNIGLPITEYPAFSFGLDQQRQPLGSGCPVNVVQVYNGLIGNVSRLESYFIGRHGEWRMVDNLRSKVNMKYDGETVGEGTMNSVGYEVPGEHEGGLFEVTITDSNVLVDGLAGQNVTTMAYRHGLDDWTPPVLQMLQFRSIDDNVTDRFSQPADGLLTFAGGDFYVSANESYPVFDVNAQVAEVWYAPYGTVNWTTLEVEEVPENFFMPGFGYFYRGALANVQGSAENGWFDLKIRLTDAVGNWQEQIISPAFRIDELVATGIEDVRCESADSGKHFYSIDGKQLSHPQPGLNVVKASDGSVRKIIW